MKRLFFVGLMALLTISVSGCFYGGGYRDYRYNRPYYNTGPRVYAGPPSVYVRPPRVYIRPPRYYNNYSYQRNSRHNGYRGRHR